MLKGWAPRVRLALALLQAGTGGATWAPRTSGGRTQWGWLWFALTQGRRQSAPCTPPSSSLLCSWPVTSLAAPRRLPSAPDHRAVCSSGPPGRTEAEREEAVTRTRPAPSLETAGVSGAQIRRLRLLKRRSRHLSVSTQVAHLRLIVCSASQAGSMSLCGQATLSPPLSLQPPPSCPFSPLCSSPVL